MTVCVANGGPMLTGKLFYRSYQVYCIIVQVLLAKTLSSLRELLEIY